MPEQGAPGQGTIAIVGAGLVGSLLACFLARRGYTIDMYEKRGDLRKGRAGEGRSINLAISVRGLHALGLVGLEGKALAQAIPMRGRMVHPVNGAPALQAYGKDDSQCINSISRAGLNALLLDAAEATGRVRVRFGQELSGADPFSGRLSFRDAGTGKDWDHAAPLVFGTDGANSALRKAFAGISGFESSESHLEHGYKEIVLPVESGRELERHALHIWPRKTYMLIALPNLDGSFTCTLFLPFRSSSDGHGAGAPGFDTLKDPAALERFFRADFPDVWERVPDLARQFFEHPTGQMTTVRARPWHAAGRTLLLGDAAHGIVPFFGQGMNCGFEDCATLEEQLGASTEKPHWEQIFSDFDRLRKPNSDAIADMAIENFIEMRDKVADPVFLFEKQVERVLAREFPVLYVPRYSQVTFSRVPYRRAYEAGEAQKRILTELCRGLKSAQDVDLARAKELIERELGHR